MGTAPTHFAAIVPATPDGPVGIGPCSGPLGVYVVWVRVAGRVVDDRSVHSTVTWSAGLEVDTLSKIEPILQKGCVLLRNSSMGLLSRRSFSNPILEGHFTPDDL